MATTAAAPAPLLSMKLLVDTKAQRVLFAEAGKDVVDFLFSLLALPVGTAVKLLGKDSMVGSAGNLYGSVEKLEAAYVLPGADVYALLHAPVPSPAVSANSSSILRLPEPSSGGQPREFFKCNYCSGCRYVSDTSGANCSSCLRSGSMTSKVSILRGEAAAGGAAKGLVQGIVTYMVMDDLTVTPMSTISGIAMLNRFGVKDLAALQEKTVQLGYDEGLAILKAALQSKTVLTDVFLAGAAPGCKTAPVYD